MIDHQIDRDERLDDFRIAAELFHRAAHRGEVDNQRHASEILEDNSGDDEGNLFLGGRFRVPIREGLDVLAPDLFAVAIPEDRLEDNPNAHRQARNGANALLFERRKRMERTFPAVAGVEFPEGFEFVRHFSSASFALILSKFGSAFASSLLSAY